MPGVSSTWVTSQWKYRPFPGHFSTVINIWLKGYEGTSLSDLTAAIGIERPSLYRVFASKEELFGQTLERYRRQHLEFVEQALEIPSIEIAIETFICRFIEVIADPDTPLGCLTLNGAIACAPEHETIRQKLVNYRAYYEGVLRRRFEAALAKDELVDNAAPEVLAHFVISVCGGLALQAKSGDLRETLCATTKMALSCVSQQLR
ncbi:TetR/AcrR family transcriptional regulator [Sphingobium sp. LB126]|uniref:TetR/AcrR family transcriptional regulator n=1 Tax=Sphingobium sp. LB126 TaxID=1983755 RepID=UPI0012FE0B41|nr:TetR/AcrR family transcriptional regulator [Sphingobium sp. LB126]